MSWNYRLVKCDVSAPTESWYELHEVYYDDAGEIVAWSQKPVAFVGHDLKEIVDMMVVARTDMKRREVLLESQLRKILRDLKRKSKAFRIAVDAK